MKFVAILFGLVTVCSTSSAVEIQLTPEEVVMCDKGGGCFITTVEFMKSQIALAVIAELKKANKSCRRTDI